jgi:Protein of unknown function (DUF4038)
LITTNPDDLLFAAGASSTNITSVESGFTSRSTAAGNLTANKSVTTTGHYSVTTTQDGEAWMMQMVALPISPTATDAAPPTPASTSTSAPPPPVPTSAPPPIAPVAPAAMAAYPLRVSSNGRYLVDQQNAPFLVAGDSPQSIIGNLSLADAEFYFADRQANGFNAAWVNLLCSSYTYCNSDGTTKDGLQPFTTPGDLWIGSVRDARQ